MRQVIERAFGLLVQRFGILWRPLRCAFDKWTLILTVCAKLHNFAINNNIPLLRNPYYCDVEENDDREIILNGSTNEDTLPRVATSNKRLKFTKDLENKGHRRPAHASLNSRAI
jgi:hypothetical protein